ncbi:putative hemagglutinin domain protein [Burkholderia pseudomallei MSHR7498]|nr:putative hemagglutinin domain protein [Burkholderia pseudomallei MSHR7498]KOT19052.1 putative hemagglutinin domain protein [Burkholderia mallei]
MNAVADAASTAVRPKAHASTCTQQPAEMPSADMRPAPRPCATLRPTMYAVSGPGVMFSRKTAAMNKPRWVMPNMPLPRCWCQRILRARPARRDLAVRPIARRARFR